MAPETTGTETDDPGTDPGVATTVPPGEDAVECPYCGRPFVRERHRTLHVGLTHYDAVTDDEAAAFEAAYEAERDELRLFRLKAAGLLVLLYFAFLFTYAVVT